MNASPSPNPETTSADIFPKPTKATNIGVFPSSVTTSTSFSRQNQPKRPHGVASVGNQIPNHPVQQQIGRLPLKQPLLPPPSFYNQPTNRVPMQGRIDSPINQNGVNPTAFGTNSPQLSVGQHPFPFVGPIHHVPIHVPQGAHRGPFPGAFVPPAVPNGAVFGAIGQTPRSQFQRTPPQNNPNYHANSVSATPPGSPNLARNANQGGQVSFSFSFLLW